MQRGNTTEVSSRKPIVGDQRIKKKKKSLLLRGISKASHGITALELNRESCRVFRAFPRCRERDLFPFKGRHRYLAGDTYDLAAV